MKEQALDLLRRAGKDGGLVAAIQPKDNYARIWSRDAMMSGIAGALLHGDQSVRDAWAVSIDALADLQLPEGAIPSNVAQIKGSSPASYGSLVGRIDATSWWVIGACLFARDEGSTTIERYRRPVEQALKTLQIWELNDRGLIYSPIGGNWADEYVTQAYTLYDQLLHLWALELASTLWLREDWGQKARRLRGLLKANYDNRKKTGANSEIYHPSAYASFRQNPLPYWAAALGPQGYDTRWDMASNALALLLDIDEKGEVAESLVAWLENLANDLGHWMLPAFWPVIDERSPDWPLLSHNYNYRFKNLPFHFHNGGSWPIFLGWLGLGLQKAGYLRLTRQIHDQLHVQFQAETPQAFTFYEYWDVRNLTPGGMTQLCFSGAGALLLDFGLHHDPDTVQKTLFL